MDYAQEQADEIEALDSIYTGYFDKLTDAPPYKVSPGRMRPRSAAGVRSRRAHALENTRLQLAGSEVILQGVSGGTSAHVRGRRDTLRALRHRACMSLRTQTFLIRKLTAPYVRASLNPNCYTQP